MSFKRGSTAVLTVSVDQISCHTNFRAVQENNTQVLGYAFTSPCVKYSLYLIDRLSWELPPISFPTYLSVVDMKFDNNNVSRFPTTTTVFTLVVHHLIRDA